MPLASAPVWSRKAAEQRGLLARQPKVRTVVDRGLIRADANRDARVAERTERHHARADLHIADGIVRNDATGLSHRSQVLFIHPNRVDHDLAFIERTEIVHILYKGLPKLLASENALEPDLKNVDVERQIVAQSGWP